MLQQSKRLCVAQRSVVNVDEVMVDVEAFSGAVTTTYEQMDVTIPVPEASEEQIMFSIGRWVIGTGDDDEFIKKSISSDGVVQPWKIGERRSGCLTANFEAARTSFKTDR